MTKPLSRSYRTNQSARLVRSLLTVGVSLLTAVDIAAEAYSLPIGSVLTAWGRL